MPDPKALASPNVDISVILCTYNRCEMLAGVLEDLAASELPSSINWEILVVDNNSTDHTRAVVEQFCRRYPALYHYLFEPRAGKAYALNSGIEHSRGHVLAFVDDDVRVEQTWLHNLTSALSETRWSGSGGRTLIPECSGVPPWFSFVDFGGVVCAHFDLGNSPQELTRSPYGVNMAIRRSMFEKYGGFRTDLGPSPFRHIPHCGEDTEFCGRLLAAGEHLRYEPLAVVYHPVPKHRLNQHYILRWWFGYGRAAVRTKGMNSVLLVIKRDYLSILKRVAVVIPTNSLRWFFTFKPQKRFRYKCWTWRAAGEITELWCRSVGIKSRDVAVSRQHNRSATYKM